MFANAENLTFKHSNINKVDGDINNIASNVVTNNNITNVRNIAEIASIQNGLYLLLRHTTMSAQLDSSERMDPARCNPATRVSVIKEVMAWVKDDNPKSSMMRMHGRAGAGKSALAQTIGELCRENGFLAASFFFSRTSKRNNGHSLIPTIAYQLAHSYPGTQAYIQKRLEKDPSLLDRSMQTIMEELIVGALTSWRCTGACILKSMVERPPRLVVIDGLDECDDPKVQCEILRVLAIAIEQLPRPIRFLVSSRPETHIVHTFSHNPIFGSINLVKIDLEDRDADADIRTFCTQEFEKIKETHPLSQSITGHFFPEDWPSPSEISDIAKKASGQFIYASTVLKYIQSNSHNPMNRLNIIRGIFIKPDQDAPFAELDGLYTHIFACVPAEYSPLLLQVLSLMVIPRAEGDGLGEFTAPSMIEKLLLLDRGELDLLLGYLPSLIGVNGPHKPIKFFHASLPEFLLDHTRSGMSLIPARSIHETLVKRYLDLLSLCASQINTPERKILISEYSTAFVNHLERTAEDMDPVYAKFLSSREDVSTLLRIYAFMSIQRTQGDGLGEFTSPLVIQQLLPLKESQQGSLLDLPTLIEIKGPNEPIQFMHSSLLSFLLDPTRSGRFSVSPVDAHADLTICYHRRLQTLATHKFRRVSDFPTFNDFKTNLVPFLNHRKRVINPSGLPRKVVADLDFIPIYKSLRGYSSTGKQLPSFNSLGRGWIRGQVQDLLHWLQDTMNKKDPLVDDLYNTYPLDPAVRSALDNFFKQPHFNEYVCAHCSSVRSEGYALRTALYVPLLYRLLNSQQSPDNLVEKCLLGTSEYLQYLRRRTLNNRFRSIFSPRRGSRPWSNEPLPNEPLPKEFADAGIDCITILLSLVPYYSRRLLTVLEALSETVGSHRELRASVMAYKLRFQMVIVKDHFDHTGTTTKAYEECKTQDIQSFLTLQFQEIRRKHPQIPESWPGPDAISTIGERGAEQPFYASVVIEYIKSRKSDPISCLNDILDLPPNPHDNAFVSHLNALYAYIFTSVENFPLLQKVLGFMALARLDGEGAQHLDPIERFTSPKMMQELLSLEESELTHLVEELSSLIYITDDLDTVNFIHESLTKFFLDPQKPYFFVDVRAARETLVRGYLRLVRIKGLDYLVPFLGHYKKAVLAGMEYLRNDLVDFDFFLFLNQVQLLAQHASYSLQLAKSLAQCLELPSRLLLIDIQAPMVAYLVRFQADILAEDRALWEQLFDPLRRRLL